MTDTSESIRRLEALIGREGISADYVRLRIGLLKAQADVLAELADSAYVPVPAKQRGTPPALQPEMVPLDAALARRLLGAIDEVFATYGDVDVILIGLRSAVDREPELVEELIRRAVFEADEQYLLALSRRLELSAELLLFVARLLAAPLVTYAAGWLRQRGATLPESDGYCPVCGSPPGLAQLRPEDGGRTLHCSLCGHGWPFARLVCPLCGNRDQATLSRLSVEGLPSVGHEDAPPNGQARWIETCRRCKHYLKTVDRRQLPEHQELLPLVEEVAGLYLDLLAEREGCRSKPPYAAVV